MNRSISGDDSSAARLSAFCRDHEKVEPRSSARQKDGPASRLAYR